MVCPCCVQQPPCPPCADCVWPDDQQDTEFGEITEGPCAGAAFTFLRAVSKTYSQVPPTILGLSVTQWAAGGQESLSGCNWVFVVDYSERSCCCPIEAQFGGLKLYTTVIWRIRVLRLSSCPEEGEPTVIDVTNDVLDLGASDVEGEFIPDLDAQPPCLEAGTCVGDYLDFFPDDLPVCNEFP